MTRLTASTAPWEAEAAFQAAVIELARLCRWRCYHTHDSRHSAAGFPDLCLVRESDRESGGRLIFAELKSARGRLRAEQRAWLDALGASVPGVEAYLWRPADWPAIERVLMRDRG